MKSINIALFGGFLAMSALFGAVTAHATVGGPTLIGQFSYNPKNESVYYVLQSYSGKGCPPLLQRISLASGAVTTALSCDEGFRLTGDDYSSGDKVSQRIADMTEGFKYLTPISLPKNDIKVDVNFVKAETLEDSPDFVTQSHFVASVYQKGRKIDQFEIAGCDVDQPFSFAGYAIPGFEKKMVLLSSTKGDCWEGGYTFERLYVVGGIQVLDRASSGNDYKGFGSALIPSAGTLVVFERDAVLVSKTAATTTNTVEQNTSAIPYVTIIVGFVALVSGVLLGKFFFGQRRIM